MLFRTSLRGSTIFASMYIGGGLGMQFVGLSVGSFAASSGSALNGLCSLISWSHCFFFQVYQFSSRLRTGLPSVFCWRLPPSSFLHGVLVRYLSVGLCFFHDIVFFLYICRVCCSIYKICVSWVGYFYWWNLRDSTLCQWAFALSLSLPSCRTFTRALFRTSV